jgi:hypothetical protein
MACHSELIPAYLHWNERQIYLDVDFLHDHRIYRIGNPIEFPSGTITAWSCKWSNFINEEDVLRADDPPVGDEYKYAIVQAIRNYFLKIQKTEGANLGWHKLTCTFIHTPRDCDYSHCEILIVHSIYQEENEETLINSWTYTHQIWQAKEALLQKDGFYKTLRKDYRKDLIGLFIYPLIQ